MLILVGMTPIKNTPNIEKKFRDVFGRSPAEGTSLEDKVKAIAELRQELKAHKRHIAKESLEKGFKGEVQIITKLNRSLRDRMNRAAKKVAQDFEKIAELDRQYEGKGIFTSEKAAEFENSKKSQTITKDMLLVGKVKVIDELNQELKAQKGRKDEVKIITKLIQNLEDRMDRAAKKIAQDFEKIAELDQQYEGKEVFTSEKAAEFESSKKSQTIPKGKISEQNKQEKTSVQTDKIHDSVSEADTTGRAVSEDKNFEQKKISMQTDTKPLVTKSQTISSSVSRDSIKDKPNDKKPEKAKISLKQVSADRNATEKKSNNKKSQLSEKENIAQPQEKQKEGGFLWRFLKKILEKLFGKDKKSVEDIKGTAQKSTSNDEGQQKNKLFDNISSQDQSVSKGLKQVDDPSVTPVNTPGVEKTSTGRER